MSLSTLPRRRIHRAVDGRPAPRVDLRRAAARSRRRRGGDRAPVPMRPACRLLRDDAGMSTVEYAIGCVAAAGFAALLYSVVTGDSVTAALTQLVQRALTAGF